MRGKSFAMTKFVSTSDGIARISAFVERYDPEKREEVLPPSDGPPGIPCRQPALSAVGLDPLLAGAKVECGAAMDERGPEVSRIFAVDFAATSPGTVSVPRSPTEQPAATSPRPDPSSRRARGAVKRFLEPGDGSPDVFCHLRVVEASGHETLPRPRSSNARRSRARGGFTRRARSRSGLRRRARSTPGPGAMRTIAVATSRRMPRSWACPARSSSTTRSGVSASSRRMGADRRCSSMPAFWSAAAGPTSCRGSGFWSARRAPCGGSRRRISGRFERPPRGFRHRRPSCSSCRGRARVTIRRNPDCGRRAR